MSDDAQVECDNCGDMVPKSQVFHCPLCDWSLCSKCGGCMCVEDDDDDDYEEDDQ